MAIKVITPGNLSKAPTYTRTCPECGCVFEYKFSDTFESGWRGGYTAVTCPTCGYAVAHLVAGGGDDINHPKLSD